MAVIGKIREKSTLVLIIIGGAIVAFVLSDLFSSSAGGNAQGPLNLAVVDGHTVSPQEYEDKLQEAYENYEMQSQQPLDERTKSAIRENIWTSMMQDIIIGRETDELGMKVTTKELFDMVQGNEPHPTVKKAFTNPETGEFNSAQVVAFLQNMDQNPEGKEQWISFEKALKSNQLVDKYNNLITKGIYYPTSLASGDYKDNATRLSFKYVYKPYDALNDSLVELSESEIEEYYEENKKDYDQKASTRLYYAYFPVQPSQHDIMEARQWAQDIQKRFQTAKNDSTFVNANSDERFDPVFYSKATAPARLDTALWQKDSGYVSEVKQVENTFYIHKVRKTKMAPDSVEASHILISTQNRSAAEAEAIADSVMNELENGSVFSAVAMDISDDPGSAEKGGELGWFAEGMMVKPFNEAAFSAEVGELKKVKSQFGYHIIKVTDKTEVNKKIQIATISREALPGKETYAELFNQANSFSIDANDLESFNNLINERNIQRRMAVLGENDNQLPNTEASRDLVRWAKDAEEGDVSEAYDIGDAFAVAVVESQNEEGAAPLDKVRNRVEFMARQQKKAEVFKEELSGASNIGDLAAKTNLSVENAKDISFSSPAIPEVGLEPVVIGKAMSLEQGQMSVPIEGNAGVFVIQLENKVVPGGEPEIAQTRTTNFRGLQTRVQNGAVLDAMRKEAEIEDNRSKFY
jgi:peptidyl-prolyl cis-trans isomerase D